MTKIIYSITFLSSWHCSSGLTSSADIDLLVLKDKYGLPYVPGKTLKGLFREAAERLAELEGQKKDAWQNFIAKNFGDATCKHGDHSKQGCCYFSNAEATKRVKEYFYQQKREKKWDEQHLYRQISSTAIENDGTGQAKEHSLRKIEVAIPMTLFAEVSGCEDKEKMEKCMKWVKRLGSNRNRGLGRCNIKLKEIA